MKTFSQTFKPARRSQRERERIPNEDRLLIYGAQTVCIGGLAFVADAYYGASKPLWPLMEIGLMKHGSLEYETCHVDHIYPLSKRGNNEIANYQALAESVNSYGFNLNGQRYPQRPYGATEGKGARILMHSQWVGMMCDEKVNVVDFAISWNDFLMEFDANGKLRGKYWPFWLREEFPPHRPVAPGWNGKILDKKEAFKGDWTRRARFARIFLKHTTPEIAERYKIYWRQKIGFEL